MAKIIPFPNIAMQRALKIRQASAMPVRQLTPIKSRSIFSIFVAAIWVLTILFSPLIRVVVYVDLFVHAVRAVYFWNAPDSHEGLVFLLHAAAYLTLVCFLFLYDHKKFERGSSRT